MLGKQVWAGRAGWGKSRKGAGWASWGKSRKGLAGPVEENQEKWLGPVLDIEKNFWICKPFWIQTIFELWTISTHKIKSNSTHQY
jgi:hypothetical protein